MLSVLYFIGVFLLVTVLINCSCLIFILLSRLKFKVTKLLILFKVHVQVQYLPSSIYFLPSRFFICATNSASQLNLMIIFLPSNVAFLDLSFIVISGIEISTISFLETVDTLLLVLVFLTLAKLSFLSFINLLYLFLIFV